MSSGLDNKPSTRSSVVRDRTLDDFLLRQTNDALALAHTAVLPDGALGEEAAHRLQHVARLRYQRVTFFLSRVEARHCASDELLGALAHLEAAVALLPCSILDRRLAVSLADELDAGWA